MVRAVELTVDVTAAAGLGRPARTAVTVYLPDPGTLSDPPVICFGFPGGGYGRRYYALDALGDPDGQAGWHASRGWVFVACDHLGVGDSTVLEVDRLDYENISAANQATVDHVVAGLRDGSLVEGYPAVGSPAILGFGQSMGGCFTIVLQGQHHPFDGVGILGYSAIHTVVPSRPGLPPVAMPWMTRSRDLAAAVTVNAATLESASAAGEGSGGAGAAEHPWTWSFHHDDEPPDLVAQDMAGMVGGPLPVWRSATVPACAILMVSPGTVAAEAAAINVPVFVGTGERDVVPDPRREPQAYLSASDVTVFICPRMAHMHNFAPTRHRLWARLHTWGTGVAAALGGDGHRSH